MERSNTASWLSSLGEGDDSSGGDDDTEDAVEEIPEQKTVTTPPKTAFNSGVKKPARPQPEWMGKLVSGRSRQSFVPSKLDQRRIELAALSEDTHLPDIQEDKDWRPQKGDLVMRKGEQCLVRKTNTQTCSRGHTSSHATLLSLPPGQCVVRTCTRFFSAVSHDAPSHVHASSMVR